MKVYGESSFRCASLEQESSKVSGEHIGILVVTYSRLKPLTPKAFELNKNFFPTSKQNLENSQVRFRV
jgi:hypothetical protein